MLKIILPFFLLFISIIFSSHANSIRNNVGKRDVGTSTSSMSIFTGSSQMPRKKRAASSDLGSTGKVAETTSLLSITQTPNGRKKRGAKSTTSLPSSGSPHKREVETTPNKLKKREAGSTTTQAASSSGSPHKMEAMTTFTTQASNGRKKRGADLTTSSITQTSSGRKKRWADSTTALPFTPSGSPHKRGAETSSLPLSTQTSSGRKKRMGNSTISQPYTISGSPHKREAMTTLTTQASNGHKKREANSTTIYLSTTNGSRHKRAAETTQLPLTTQTPNGRKKREAESTLPSTSRGSLHKREGETTLLPMNTEMTSIKIERKQRQVTTMHPGKVTGEMMAGQNNGMMQPTMGRQRRDAKDLDITDYAITHEAKEDIAPHHRFPTPHFIKDLNPEQRRQFFEIKSNFTLTKKEMHDELQKWLNSQPANIQDDYKIFHKNMEKLKEDISHKIHSNLSSEGKLLFDKIKSFMDDDGLTMHETCENIQRVIDEAPEKVRNELHCNERMPLPSGGDMPPPRRVDACHGHFNERLKMLVTTSVPIPSN